MKRHGWKRHDKSDIPIAPFEQPTPFCQVLHFRDAFNHQCPCTCHCTFSLRKVNPLQTAGVKMVSFVQMVIICIECFQIIRHPMRIWFHFLLTPTFRLRHLSMPLFLQRLLLSWRFSQHDRRRSRHQTTHWWRTTGRKGGMKKCKPRYNNNHPMTLSGGMIAAIHVMQIIFDNIKVPTSFSILILCWMHVLTKFQMWRQVTCIRQFHQDLNFCFCNRHLKMIICSFVSGCIKLSFLIPCNIFVTMLHFSKPDVISKAVLKFFKERIIWRRKW